MGLMLTASVFFSPIIFVRTAHANIFAFLGSIFKDSGSAGEFTELAGSRALSLLEAPLNENPMAGKGGGNITIVNDNALLAEVGPLGSVADAEEWKNAGDKISVYVVRDGDSLSEIARMFDVSVNTIIWANDIKKGDAIKTGQTLIILPVSGVKYVVKEGDTISSIAKKFKGDIGEIIQFNDLSFDEPLAAGREIVIPDGELSAPSLPRTYAQERIRGSGPSLYQGYYLRPINGGRKTQGLHGYNGVDLATSCGEPIFASASGDVIIARSYGWNGGYGKYIVISHQNNTQTLYAHNSENIVSPGWRVVKGQVIGYVGSTGRSSGCHIHFEVRGSPNPF
ncbi:MAG: Peptidase M23 family protein [Parcubacteria group bacterium GW2011_GWB1_41_6]|nr:MAG: Peptidase M23 family protein [Parcubacteria group bacterium GW2011_GWB1_41_6]KKS56817.1 MAG: Peptidase M23 family protein [Parcubacteria group bacterium GW2011_GWA2_42_35]